MGFTLKINFNVGSQPNDGNGDGLRTNLLKLIDNDEFLKALAEGNASDIQDILVDVANNTLSIGQKADQTSLDSLNITVDTKASQSDLDNAVTDIGNLQSSMTTAEADIDALEGKTVDMTFETNTTAFGQNISVVGDIAYGTLTQTSDRSMKEKIEYIDGEKALEIFKQLRFATFFFKGASVQAAGLIAQEVEEVLPEAVKTDKAGKKLINYTYIDTICKAAMQHFIIKNIS